MRDYRKNIQNDEIRILEVMLVITIKLKIFLDAGIYRVISPTSGILLFGFVLMSKLTFLIS